MARTLTPTGEPHVAILMATFDGAPFIDEQLHSIAVQRHRNWSLWVSDDGSTDGTCDRVEAFRAANPDHRIVLREGPRAGSTRNFLSLLCDASVESDYVALADQDDVWLPEKLSRALDALAKAAADDSAAPCLYGGRTIITDADLRPRGLSPLFGRPGCFANALVQNIAGGNTMVLNRAAHRLIARAGAAPRAACHDWWIYQVVTGAGGRMIYDPQPTLLYRQHGANQIGANATLRARIARLAGLLNGRFALWNAGNIAALRAVAPILTPEARARLDAFALLRGVRGPAAVNRLRTARIYRQTTAGTASLGLGAFFGLL